MQQHTCWLAAILLLVLGGLASAASIRLALWPIYQLQLESPCQYVGYSFPGTEAQLARMKQDGAEIAGMNRMWIPIQDPKAPDGLGYIKPGEKITKVSQKLRLSEPFCGLMVLLPTDFLTGSLTMTLRGKQGVIAQQRFEDVEDEHPAQLSFQTQPPGDYVLQFDDPKGSIGLWVAPGKDDHVIACYEDDKLQSDHYLEFAWCDEAGNWHWVSKPDSHKCLKLSAFPNENAMLNALGFKSMFWVGNWNNGAFPYYADWFYERFPDIVMLDVHDRPIMAGMFGYKKGWPSIDSPIITTHTAAFIRDFVKSRLEAPNLVYWALGGEALYPTYFDYNLGWADYSQNAQAHFRAWLERKYGTIEALNRTWGSAYSAFSEVQAPREKSISPAFADWLDYRFAAMGERMSWHYAAVRSVDKQRPVLTTNHGNIFWGLAYPALGADFPQYADASDGFEMGQIMTGSDPGYYNLWYAAALAGLGKIGAPARLAYKFPNPKARGGGTSYTPEAVRRYCMEAFGSGWWHLGLIQFAGSLPDGEWGIVGTPAEETVKQVFSDLKHLRSYARGAWPVLPEIGLYLAKYRWELEGWSPEWTTLHTWCIQHQYSHAICWEQQLLSGAAVQYPVLIAAHDDLMTKAALEALKRYLDAGGHLIVIGKFAERSITGESLAEARQRLLANPKVHVLGQDVPGILGKLPQVLAQAGVGPVVKLESRNEVQCKVALEPLHGQHDTAFDLSGHSVVGETFVALGQRLLGGWFATPTYTKQPKGFSVELRVRKGGPKGPILAKVSVPADAITDNAWTGGKFDLPVTPGETYFLEIAPPEDLPENTLGVWAMRQGQALQSKAYVDGQATHLHFETKVTFLVASEAATSLEAFTLSDGANFVVPLVNLAESAAKVQVTLPASKLAKAATSYLVKDALSDKVLAEGASCVVEVPAHDYRVLFFACRASSLEVRSGMEALSRKLQQAKAQGWQVDYPLACLQAAGKAFVQQDYSKAYGLLQLGAQAPLVKAIESSYVPGKSYHVAVEARDSEGKPFSGASGVLHLVPLPEVDFKLRETAPGRYEGTVPAKSLTAYDYHQRRYRAYEGPLQVIINLYKGRALAEYSERLR